MNSLLPAWGAPDEPDEGSRPGQDPVPSHGFRASALLDVRGLRISRAGGAEPWPREGISLSIGHGEALGLVGDIGSGRSELALAIAGRLPPSAVIRSGSILFDGLELVGRPRRWFARRRGPRLGSLTPGAPGGTELLIFDDPTGGGAPADHTVVLALLAALRPGRTVIIGSADFSVVASTCDRVAVLDSGRIVEQGATAEIMAAPTHPLTRALLGRT